MQKIVIFCTVFSLAACSLRRTTDQGPTASALPGDVLARTHCGGCHQFPDPALLDKKTWETRILPEMGSRLGIANKSYNPLFSLTQADLLTVMQAGIYPSTPQIAEEDWRKIEQYYLQNAPDKPLPQEPKVSPALTILQFKIQKLILNAREVPFVTFVHVDAQQRLWFGTRTNKVYRLNAQMQKEDSLLLDSPPSDFRVLPNGTAFALTMGIMDPNDQPQGTVQAFDTQQRPQRILGSLQRPVEMAWGDLNADGLEDLAVCQYGNYTGKLVWYEKRPNGTYQEHLLKPVAGARRVILQDMNHDSRPDLVVLMAQGNEGVSIYFNEGKGQFQEKVVLNFPPVHGSTYVEVLDFDQDGDYDLVYTNGDNADYSVIPKAYHGVKLFLNDGQNRFKEVWHYPIYGASMVKAADFDGDGDYDLAVAAFHREPELAPNEGFVYLRNDGKLRFTPMTFAESARGRWLTMTLGDPDRDGDTDIVLGSFLLTGLGNIKVEPGYRPAELVVLRNQQR
jgi:hypothetical protein